MKSFYKGLYMQYVFKQRCNARFIIKQTIKAIQYLLQNVSVFAEKAALVQQSLLYCIKIGKWNNCKKYK
jgi:hypothetical protein